VRDLEERIRQELTTVAAQATHENIHPLRAPAASRRPRPRFGRWLAPIAVMAAVAVIAGVTVAVHTTTRGPAPAANRPDVYVTLTAQYLQPPSTSSSSSSPILSGGKIVLFATVRNASTGASLTSVQVWPRQPEHPRGQAVAGPLGTVAQIAGAADDRTFAISFNNGVYLLHVAASGSTARLVDLSRTITTNASSSIALSPDGTQLAVDLDHCPVNGACVDGIEILNLVTGTARTWLGSSAAIPLDPYWTDNGKAVAFEWASGGWPKNGYRILSDTAPQGNLIAESTPLPYPPTQRSLPPEAILTPDGRNLIVVTESIVPGSHNSGDFVFRVTDEDPATGHVLRVLHVFTYHYQGNPYAHEIQCNILSLAPTGLSALLTCPQLGHLDGSTFTSLPSGSASLPNAPTIAAAW
jgi:hypothetical protein